jgi:hypothetical protein
MSTTTCVSGKTDSGGHAPDDCLAVLPRRLVSNQASGTAANSKGVSFDAASTALRLETAVMVLGLIQVVHPNGEGPGGIGAAVEVVASVLDVKTHVMLTSWKTVSVELGVGKTFRSWDNTNRNRHPALRAPGLRHQLHRQDIQQGCTDNWGQEGRCHYSSCST